jgi:hypothetical protein
MKLTTVQKVIIGVIGLWIAVIILGAPVKYAREGGTVATVYVDEPLSVGEESKVLITRPVIFWDVIIQRVLVVLIIGPLACIMARGRKQT